MKRGFVCCSGIRENYRDCCRFPLILRSRIITRRSRVVRGRNVVHYQTVFERDRSLKFIAVAVETSSDRFVDVLPSINESTFIVSQSHSFVPSCRNLNALFRDRKARAVAKFPGTRSVSPRRNLPHRSKETKRCETERQSGELMKKKWEWPQG